MSDHDFFMLPDRVRDEPNVEVYFQSDGRGGAGMKDLVREFIRKATQVS